MWRLGITLAMVIVACGQVAASQSDAGADANSPPQDSTFAHVLAETICDNVRDCCETNLGFFDKNECMTVAQSDVQQVVVSERTTLQFHAELVPDCLKALGALVRVCDRNWERVDWLPLWVPECARVFSGGAPLGARCAASGDCGSWNCRGYGVKRCSAFVPQLGDPCEINSYYGDECIAPGLWNDYPTLRCDDATHQCAPLLDLGEQCSINTDCKSDAFCDRTDKVCRARVPIGSPCGWSGDRPFDSPGCVSGAWCSTRVACTPLQSLGDKCSYDAECPSNVCEGRCYASFFATPAHCGAP
jgi:hypothetical protein